MSNLSVGAKLWMWLFAAGLVSGLFGYAQATALKYSDFWQIYFTVQGVAVFVLMGFVMNGRARIAELKSEYREEIIELRGLLAGRIGSINHQYSSTTNNVTKKSNSLELPNADPELPIEEAERLGKMEWDLRMDKLKGKDTSPTLSVGAEN